LIFDLGLGNEKRKDHAGGVSPAGTSFVPRNEEERVSGVKRIKGERMDREWDRVDVIIISPIV
jgi:hypothetical protein